MEFSILVSLTMKEKVLEMGFAVPSLLVEVGIGAFSTVIQ
jgi:hypothetical protein